MSKHVCMMMSVESRTNNVDHETRQLLDLDHDWFEQASEQMEEKMSKSLQKETVRIVKQATFGLSSPNERASNQASKHAREQASKQTSKFPASMNRSAVCHCAIDDFSAFKYSTIQSKAEIQAFFP